MGSYNLSSFKRQVYHHLRGVETFLSMLRNLFSLNPFYTLFICFYLFYSFNQPFAAQAGQGHSCPSWSYCAPLQGHAVKKKKKLSSKGRQQGVYQFVHLQVQG